MTLSTLLMTTLVVLPALGLAAWSWQAMARATADLESLDGFEGLHHDR